MKIVVIGGTGRVGGNVVRRLVAHGHDPVPASPSTGVDTITGEGLAEVMTGADAVVDVSSSVGPRRWASTRGRGGCSPPPATLARSSATRTRRTTGPSSTAAS